MFRVPSNVAVDLSLEEGTRFLLPRDVLPFREAYCLNGKLCFTYLVSLIPFHSIHPLRRLACLKTKHQI